MGSALTLRPVAVLIVDDDADIRESVAEVLKDEGFSVAEAANGAEALSLLKTLRPSVILLDLNMPVMSGAEFRHVQLGDPSLSSIATVIMTAADRMKERASELLVQEALAKPMDVDRLIAVVKRHCGTTEIAPA